MCGIVGFTGAPQNHTIQYMCDSIIHRGPDSSGYKELPKISIGMRRLSIVDIEGGQQPVCNEDKSIWIVFNGEIYNHRELRPELLNKGHQFHSHWSDTEVIVHLYEEHGNDWPNYVNGMFAVAIWDSKTEQLSLYRDRLGKKPLYYTCLNGELIFSSEIKSILAFPGVSREIDYSALYHYLGNKNISDPKTIYRSIHSLSAGCFLNWANHSASVSRYWSADFTPHSDDISEREFAEQIFKLLQDSVSRRMDCDVPFGAYLSGGVDSSAVASLMAQSSSKPIQTFCLGYTDLNGQQSIGKQQDSIYAREMAKRLGSDHHEMFIDSARFATDIQHVIRSFDQPFSGTISTYYLSYLIAQHVKVALSGDGADELFGSYLTHRLSFPLAHLATLGPLAETSSEQTLLSDTLLAPFNSKEGIQFLQKLSLRKQHWRDSLAVFPVQERHKLLSDEVLAEINNRELNDELYMEHLRTSSARDPLNITLELDQKELLVNQILPFVDRLSMAHSVEVRCPFLDYRLVEFVNRIPGRFKIKNCVNKYILKLALQDLLPEHVISRPKEGFVQPIYTWMHNQLKQWICDELENTAWHIFRKDYIRTLRQQFLNGNTSVNAKVWNLVCFNIWYRNYK